MSTLKNFEQAGRRGFYRPVGVMTFDQAVEIVGEGMRHARSLELVDLLVNTGGLTGFPPPDVFARYSLALKWAQSAGASLRVALVARAELIDPEKIGLLMAQNRGVAGDVFTSEAAAVAWLDARVGVAATKP
ncbi:MAG TPA: hypothetical protein VFU13_19065 [Steroidobacteraceae bacterium]|nr:hypothetical protein [Steroidobacteraceae bacterium]